MAFFAYLYHDIRLFALILLRMVLPRGINTTFLVDLYQNLRLLLLVAAGMALSAIVMVLPFCLLFFLDLSHLSVLMFVVTTVGGSLAYLMYATVIYTIYSCFFEKPARNKR